MTRIEAVTYDVQSGCAVVDHVWRVARHHGVRKLAKLRRRAARWTRKAAEFDKSSTHAVYTREV